MAIDYNEAFLFAFMPIFIDEVRRLLDLEPKAQELMVTHSIDIMGGLSIVSQCPRQLEFYQPLDTELNFDFASRRYQNNVKDVGQKNMGSVPNHSVTQPRNLGQAPKLGQYTGQSFAHPASGHLTKENVQPLRQSPVNSDDLYCRVDGKVPVKTSDLEGMTVHRLLSRPRTKQCHMEWMERNPDIVSTKTHRLDRLSVKTKAKTKGVAKSIPGGVFAGSPLGDSDHGEPQSTISVNARALKVFRTLFFDSSPAATPGEVPWKEFLYALTSIGFAAEKLHGSVWRFRPMALYVDRDIQFHEPHPHGKIPFHVARRHGRRLSRTYGWSGCMFTLKEK